MLILLYSTIMAVGLCTTLGLITTVTAIEVLPFLVVAIGLDNMTVITSSIVSKWGLPIRFQVAEGLAKAGPQLIKSLLSMEGTAISASLSTISHPFISAIPRHSRRVTYSTLVPILVE